jgi:hypothetical protein
MNDVNSIIKSLEICDNLGNINIISKYIDDGELLNILTDDYWLKETNINTLVEMYILDHAQFSEDDLQGFIAHYESSSTHLTRNIHDILLYYFTEYNFEDIHDIINFNEKKKALDIWLRLSIINYKNLMEYLSTHFTLRKRFSEKHISYA